MTEVNEITQKMEFNSSISNIAKIEELIDKVCDTHHITEDYYGNILIALTEAVNNAIVHGNHLDSSKKVSLCYETKNNQVCFIVKDEGKGFDFTKIPDPTIPQNINKLNGRGVFLMRLLADEVVFEENGSKVKLKFCITNN